MSTRFIPTIGELVTSYTGKAGSSEDRMRPSLDLLDVKILACIDRYGPRNISEIARKVGKPYETVRKRFKRLVSQFFVKFPLNIYHTHIGLKKAFVFADAVLGYEDVLRDCMKANDFWSYVGRYYGRCEGCYAIYVVPVGHLREFEEFVHELEDTCIARNVRFLWSTCLHAVNPTVNWFDADSQEWVFNWREWVEEIPEEGTELPPTLAEPEEFPIKADDTDILILAELEVDYTTKMKEIARALDITPEAVEYHYYNHIVERGLIEKSQVFFLRFDKAVSDFFVFIFKFDSEEKTAKFASSLLDKPFVYGLGRLFGENGLIAHIYLPRQEFRKFTDSLSCLARRDLLKGYEYIIEDFGKKESQTISYEHFKDGTWIYNHEKHLNDLKKTVEEAKESYRR